MIIYMGVLGLCSQSFGDFEQSNLDWRLISGAPMMTSSIMVSEMKQMRNE